MSLLVRSNRVASPRPLLNVLMRALERVAGSVAACLIAHRKAKAAEEIYRYLSRLSDAELAARGLDRRRLTQFLAERLG